jgi:predicted Zn-dependent protease
MSNAQEIYDEAMFEFSRGDYDSAIGKLKQILAGDPANFEAQLAFGMAFFRKGDYPRAIAEGHKAEQLRPREQLVHTNLSLFYMKAGDKTKAEHHGLQARISSWRDDLAGASAVNPAHPDLEIALGTSKPAAKPPPTKFPDMPWKKKPPAKPPGSA